MEDQIQLIKKKLSKAQKKENEKKIQKYQQQLKELESQNNQSEQSDQDSDQEEDNQKLSLIQITENKLAKAQRRGNEKKINKFTQKLEKLKKQQASSQNERDKLEEEEVEKKSAKKSKKMSMDSQKSVSKKRKMSQQSEKKIENPEDQEEEHEEEETQKKQKAKKNKKKSSEHIEEQEQNSNKKNSDEKEEQEEEEVDFEQLLELYQAKLQKAEEKKKQKKIAKYTKKVREMKSNILAEKIASLKQKCEKAESKGKQEKVKTIKENIKQLKKERRTLETELISEDHQEIEDMVNEHKKERKTSVQNNYIKQEDIENAITIVLFYQYIEPQWSHRRYKEALQFTQQIGQQLQLGGRLRVAYEGFNGTISGSYHNVRQFTEELKKWEPQSFSDTFFKFIDGNPKGTHFPKIKVFEVKELVNYGLHGHQPSIEKYGGVHLSPADYHKKMEEGNSVIIDVRNTYESIIGKFDPPDQSKCLWIDPKWRKSTEIVDWLKNEETRKQLRGKKVLMYCTGGVRCERASAYLQQEIGDQVEGIFQLKGGIEQYMLEFPEGGYWKGKNYTFDKRFAFGAYEKENDEQIMGNCAGCNVPWDRYRGKKRCSSCLVPLLVCRQCHENELDKKRQLRCTLCVEQNKIPRIKRVPVMANQNQQPQQPAPNPDNVTRLFVGNLPFNTNEESVRSLFRPAKIKDIQWLKDKNTQQFYGSLFIETETPECAGYCLAVNGRKLKGRVVRVNYEARKGK